MSFINFATGGGASIANRSDPGEELVGWTSTDFTQLTAGSANTKGSYSQLGTGSGATWKGVTVLLAIASSVNVTFAVDVSFDSGTTDTIKNLVVKSTTSGDCIQIYLPLSIPTTTTANAIQARCQCTGSGGTIKIALIGHLDNDSQARPLWANMASDSVDLSQTAVDNNTITVGTGSGSYVDIATTTQNFGAILPLFQSNTSASAMSIIRFSTDGTDTGKFATRALTTNSTNPTWITSHGPVIYHPISSGTVISAAADSATAFGSVRIGYSGFYD